MTSRRIDQWLSFVGAVLILMSSYQLFFSHKGSYEGATLGHVSALEKVVKIKRARALDWVDAFANDLVTENQMIYTDELSRAEVRFSGGQKLIINENSLVRIRSRGKDNELDIGRGTVRATLAEHESFIFKLNGKDYTLRGKDADVEINLHDNVGEIGVVSGTVELEQDGKTTKLDEKTALVVEGEKSSTKILAYTISVPERGKTIYTGGESSTVGFTWTGEADGKILLSQSPDLSGAETFGVTGNGYSKALSPGHYYWKLEGTKGDSLISDFRIVKEVPPEILRPKDGETIDLFVDKDGNRTVRLEWEGEGENFVVDHQGNTRTQNKYLDISAEGNEFTWKVKIDSPERPEAAWSAPQKIKVRTHLFPEVPVNLNPDGVEYQSFSKQPEDVEISWASSFATDLEIERAGTTESIRPEGSSYIFKPNSGGKYKWRVRGRDEFSRTSAWTEWKEFSIVDLSGEKNAEGIQRIQLTRPDQEVTFGWEGKGTNVFELSRDRSFHEVIISKEINGTETKLSVPRTGTYYWRSREFRKDGTINVSEPKKVIIEPVPAPVKPEALPPMEVPLEHAEPTTTFFSFFLNSAYADDVFGVARITLPEREHVKQYVLRIYRKGEDKPLVEQKLTERTFLWKEALPGEYDFQYAVVDYFDRQSPFSDRSSLVVREAEGPARPLLISPIRLEKVTTPEVVYRWGHAERAKKYRFSLYRDEAMKEKVFEKETSSPELSSREEIADGTYYWQTEAIDERGDKTPSSVGRFVYEKREEKKEEIIAVPDIAPDWWKNRRDRAHIAWAPSHDSYKFKGDDKSGKIDGTALMGIEGRATFFREKWIYSGEFLRQSGKVFKKESYSFMKGTVDAGWILKSGKHTFTAGPALGFAMGQSYSITGDVVKASGVSGAVYGVVGRSFHSFTPKFFAEGKLSYLLGAVTEMEISGNFLRKMSDYYLVLGAGIVNRQYSKNNGEQSSLKLNAGIGHEF